jgi:hypothetical protein
MLACCAFTTDKRVNPTPGEAVFALTEGELERAIDGADDALLTMGPAPAPGTPFGLTIVIDGGVDAMLEVVGAVLWSGST